MKEEQDSIYKRQLKQLILILILMQLFQIIYLKHIIYLN